MKKIGLKLRQDRVGIQRTKLFSALVLILVVTMSFVGCDTDVSISPSELKIRVGETQELRAIVDGNSPANLVWTSDYPGCVSVEKLTNGRAKVTANYYSAEPVTITALIPNKACAVCMVTVKQD